MRTRRFTISAHSPVRGWGYYWDRERRCKGALLVYFWRFFFIVWRQPREPLD